MAEITLGDLYTFNKQAMSKVDPLTATTFHLKVEEMIDDLYDNSKPYWMLLCRERNDFTLFIMLTKKGTYDEIIPTLMNRGKVLSIDRQEDGNYEIWIRDPETNENFVYYFFDYTFGVIKA